jgi:hypothetical protein
MRVLKGKVLLKLTKTATANANQMAPILIALALALFAGGPSRADDVAASGWQTITSKSGHCTVSLPGIVSKSVQDAGPHRTVTFMSSPDQGKSNCIMQYTTYSAEYLRKRSRTRLLQEAMHQSVSMLLGKVTSRKEFDLDGHEALEFDFEGFSRDVTHTLESAARTVHGRGRVIWANDREYVLVCDTTNAELNATCQKFFDSLKITF